MQLRVMKEINTGQRLVGYDVAGYIFWRIECVDCGDVMDAAQILAWHSSK